MISYCSYAQTNTFPSSGYVGIGTTNPVSALDVNGTGRFSVTSSNPYNTVQVPLVLSNSAGNGGAGTHINFSIGNAISYINSIIEGSNSAAGSALSFGTPSTDGLSLGDMNTKLLKKVEELTLYLIAKDKQLKDQQEKSEQQDVRIAALEVAFAKLTVNK